MRAPTPINLALLDFPTMLQTNLTWNIIGNVLQGFKNKIA